MDLKGKMELYIEYNIKDFNIRFGRHIRNEEDLKNFINEAIENNFTITEIINNLGY